MINDGRKMGGQLLLRFPETSDLRQCLQELADKNNRTLTSEIIHRLELSIDRDGMRGPLAKIQTSPTIQLEKRLGKIEIDLEEQIDNVRERVSELEREVAALKAKELEP